MGANIFIAIVIDVFLWILAKFHLSDVESTSSNQWGEVIAPPSVIFIGIICYTDLKYPPSLLIFAGQHTPLVESANMHAVHDTCECFFLSKAAIKRLKLIQILFFSFFINMVMSNPVLNFMQLEHFER